MKSAYEYAQIADAALTQLMDDATAAPARWQAQAIALVSMELAQFAYRLALADLRPGRPHVRPHMGLPWPVGHEAG